MGALLNLKKLSSCSIAILIQDPIIACLQILGFPPLCVYLIEVPVTKK